MGRPLNTPTKPKAHKRKLACTNPTLDHLKQNTQTQISWLTSQRTIQIQTHGMGSLLL